ncbi:hypothetical protein [Bacillus cereus]|uniref:hypothetical protein n=1 Tax=Bacillus cereus TaxID=1396 RepID=UPI00211D62BD|nr:hypothetical protein [Bacillus cereus]
MIDEIMACCISGVDLTEAANECVEALEKLEKVMGKFNEKGDFIECNVPLILDGKVIAEAALQFQRDIIRAKPF